MSINKLKTITKAWAKVLLKYTKVLSSEEIELARKRLLECDSCEHEERGVCKACGCPLVAKSLSELSEENKCKTGKWYKYE